GGGAKTGQLRSSRTCRIGPFAGRCFLIGGTLHTGNGLPACINMQEVHMIENSPAPEPVEPSGPNGRHSFVRPFLLGAALLICSMLTLSLGQQSGVTPIGLSQAERAKVFAG